MDGVEPRTSPLDYHAPLLLVASYDMQEANSRTILTPNLIDDIGT